MVQINSDTSVSLLNTPKVDETDRQTLNIFLKFLVAASERDKRTYRANIMMLDPQDNLLKITVQYNMDWPNMYDQNINLPSFAGCAGHAFRNNNVITFDIKEGTYNDIFTQDEANKVWKDLKSIVSMPIRCSNANRLGVLNMDSEQCISQTNFRDTDGFGIILEKKI